MCFDERVRMRGLGVCELAAMALWIVGAIICRSEARDRLVRSPAVRAPDRDDCAFRNIRDRLQTADADVMGMAIDTVKHEVGRTLQLVVQPLLDHAANNRILRSNPGVGDRKSTGGIFLPLGRKSALHRPDDIAADAELAQR